MEPAFWSHTVWYVILGLTTLTELWLIFRRAGSRRMALGLYLSVSGMVFSLEMAVYSYFKAYEYYPKLVPHSQPDDSIAGNLFSQFSITATALLIAVYNLKTIWVVVFAAAYAGIEELFIALGIYRQHWYRSWMTVAGLLLIFPAVKWLYRKASNHIGRFARYLLIFYGLLTLNQHLINWPQRLLGIRTLSETVLPDKERSMVLLTAVFFIMLAACMMFVYFSKFKWPWKGLVVLALYAGFYLAVKNSLVFNKEGWFFVSASLCIWTMLLFCFFMDKLYIPARDEPDRRLTGCR